MPARAFCLLNYHVTDAAHILDWASLNAREGILFIEPPTGTLSDSYPVS